MNQRRTLPLAVLLRGVGVAGFIYWLIVPRISLDEFRSQIEVDLPLGTERGKVEAWLRERGLSFDDIYMLDDRKVGLHGTIRHIYHWEIGETQLLFEFHFDEDDRLREYSVREFHLFL